jgi:hypothetical protein
MGRIGWMLIGGIVALAMQAISVADDRRTLELFASGGDCSRGSIEIRLDCLTWQVEQLKRRVDGRDGRVMPLG